MIQTAITVITIWGWTQAHISNDGDYCSLAQSCLHDGAEARGIDGDGRTVRLFLDACDLYEYNCDHGTSFKLVAVTSPCTEDELTVTEAAQVDSDQWTPEKADYDNTVQPDDNNIDDDEPKKLQKIHLKEPRPQAGKNARRRNQQY